MSDKPKQIGSFLIEESLGKGGMGEVYLAHDPVAGRKVAIKRIRPELQNSKVIRDRFLREAKVASSLSHPSIVPILTLNTESPEIYYTMPFVEGSTLRQILRTAKEQEKAGKEMKSIPSLTRIFLQICEAVAYTHAKGIIHRDLKPENIIVGKFGEVMILDWGIADFIDQIGEEEEAPIVRGKNLTKPGKITGTLAYMAPERLAGKSSSVQTDLYALGVILYQMLTLQLPFRRKNLAAFKRDVDKEEFVSPIEMAPYRDIPHRLSEVCRKCLSKNETERFQSMQELVAEIKNFIEGKSDWILAARLDRNRKEDWRFQANVLLAKNVAITKSLDVTDWAEIMVSKQAFAQNVRLEAEAKLESGVGFLLNLSEENNNFNEGYRIWIDGDAARLYRSGVQVMESKLTKQKAWHQISIEKVETQVKLFVDGALKLKFDSHLPLAGRHVGLLFKDDQAALKNVKVYDGSHNVMVGCLAVPNAFLSHKLYPQALEEYRRIGQSFPGRMEGREALFRAGLTLLEQGKLTKDEKFFSGALKEFEQLYRTSGAPLEYLGKSLVYAGLNEEEEEAKCLELCLRKFPSHPLLPVIKEHIIYRMHESSLKARESAYRIILLAVRHIPDLLENPDTRHLLDSLEKNWEILPFFEKTESRLEMIAIQIAFWLAKIPILVEIANHSDKESALFRNALTALRELGAEEALKKFLPAKPKKKRSLIVWKALLAKDLKEAEKLFAPYLNDVVKETSPLHFPYGAYLYLKEGPDAAMRHFTSVLESPYPPTTALPSLFLTGKLKGWMERAFWWEKKELHRQIDLFTQCTGVVKSRKS